MFTLFEELFALTLILIYLERGGIQLESYSKFFKDDNLKKIGKIVIDKKSSLQIKKNH